MRLKLRKDCESKVLSWLLARLLSRKCGRSIPIAGENSKIVDCYTIHLRTENGELSYLVMGIDTEKKELHVYSINPMDKTFSVPEVLPLSNIPRERFNVIHYYQGSTIQYQSIFDLFFGYTTRYNVAKIKCWQLWNYLSQSRLNKRPLLAQDTIELLRFMLDDQLAQYDSQSFSSILPLTIGVSCFDLMTKIHSPRWIDHPYSERQKQKLEMHLEHLVHTQDLKKDQKGYGYIVTPKALKTIEDHERDERRHKDSLKVQRRMVLLTFVIALATLFQAWSMKAR